MRSAADFSRVIPYGVDSDFVRIFFFEKRAGARHQSFFQGKLSNRYGQILINFLIYRLFNFFKLFRRQLSRKSEIEAGAFDIYIRPHLLNVSLFIKYVRSEEHTSEL